MILPFRAREHGPTFSPSGYLTMTRPRIPMSTAGAFLALAALFLLASCTCCMG